AAAGWLLKEMGLFKGVPGQAKVEPLQARPVLTANEWEFFGRLREALPGHVVCPQVSMAAVLATRPGLSRAEATTARNRFDRKVVDFVILNQAGATVALVELDDRTHAADRDAARDAMTAAAGLRTIRYSSRAKPDLAKIAADVAGLGAAAA
ncbi:MAG: DUF2726 domain-containing protein, partial [Brevundimonas sp.]